MTVGETYPLAPTLFDIPLYRQQMEQRKEIAEKEDDEKDFVEEEREFISASEALEEYIRDFERRPADTLMAIHYGGTLEHIPVPCPRPPLSTRPEKCYLPSVTDLLSSDSSTCSDPTSPNKSLPNSPRKPFECPLKSALNSIKPENPMKGIFWDVGKQAPPPPPTFSLSPVKPSPFEKLLDFSITKINTLTDKPSPFKNLVDLSQHPLSGVSLDYDCKPHRCPSWVEDIDTLSMESRERPDWLKDLQHADQTSDVLNIIEQRLERNLNCSFTEGRPRSRLLSTSERRQIRENLLIDDVQRRRTQSEESLRQMISYPMERAASWTSLATEDALKCRVADITDEFLSDVLARRTTHAEELKPPTKSGTLTSVSGEVDGMKWGRPLEQLKNMIFTVQSLDSSSDKTPVFVDDKDVAGLLTQESESLQKAMAHLSNVRDLIKSTHPDNH